jgi:hypothetical protein
MAVYCANCLPVLVPQERTAAKTTVYQGSTTLPPDQNLCLVSTSFELLDKPEGFDAGVQEVIEGILGDVEEHGAHNIPHFNMIALLLQVGIVAA